MDVVSHAWVDLKDNVSGVFDRKHFLIMLRRCEGHIREKNNAWGA